MYLYNMKAALYLQFGGNARENIEVLYQGV